MLWTNVKYYSQVPFVNLSTRAKVIFAFRLFSLMVSVVMGVMLLTSNSSHFPILVLNCKHSDLATGLYDALKKTSTEQNNLMTTSEIKLLATYIEDHIKGTPQEIKSGINDWCAVTFNENNFFYSGGDMDGAIYELPNQDDTSDSHNVTVKCWDNVEGYTFDYRGQMSDIGLNIILAYAYSANFESHENQISDSYYEYVPDKKYQKQLKSQSRITQQYSIMLTATLCFQGIMFLFTFVYYSLRGNQMDDEKISWIPKNIFALVSTLNLIMCYAAFLTIFLDMHNIQNQVKSQLSTFGITAKYGVSFVSLSVVWLCASMIVFALWAGPVWCNRTVKKQLKNDQIPLSMEAYDYNFDYVNDHIAGQDEDYDDYDDYDDDDDGTSGEIRSHISDDDPFCETHSTDIMKHTNVSEKTSVVYPSRDDRLSFEHHIPYANKNVSILTSSSTSDETLKEPTNPFNNPHAAASEIILSRKNDQVPLPFKNTAFMRSDQLFTRRKPPTENGTFSQEAMILMSPIISEVCPLEQEPVKPQVDCGSGSSTSSTEDFTNCS